MDSGKKSALKTCIAGVTFFATALSFVLPLSSMAAMTKHGGLQPTMVKTPLEGALRKVSEMADPYEKTRILTEMAKKCSLAQQRGMALDILRLAREMGFIIPVEYDKVWAMANVAREYARAGENTRALVLFAKANAIMVACPDKVGRDTMFLEVGRLCAESRLYEQALRIGDNIDDFWSRAMLVSQVGQAMILANDYVKPIKLMERLVGRPNRSFVQADLAIAFAKAGKVNKALETARDLLDVNKQIDTIAKIAGNEIDEGRLERAIEITMSLNESIPFAMIPKCELLIKIAADMDFRGDFGPAFSTLCEARKLAEKITVQSQKAKCLAAIGAFHMSNNQTMRASWVLDDCMKELGRINGDKERLEAVLWTSAILKRAGEKDEAWALSDKVASEVKKLSNSHGEKDFIQSQLVTHYLSYDRYDLAHKTAKQIKDGSLMLKMFTEIHHNAIGDKRCDIAMNLANEITKGRHRGRLKEDADPTLTQFTSDYIQNGMFSEAMEVIRMIESPALRAVAISELAAQYEWLNRTPTDEEQYQIRYISSKLMFVKRPRQNGNCSYFMPPQGLAVVKRPDSTPANAFTHHMER
jgi:tetratricopeptide (TPR) repeat protein